MSHAMSELLPDIDSLEWAWPGLRRDAFQLLAWGYQIKEQEIRQCTKEEDITGLIRKGIRIKLDDDVPPRFKCYSAHNEDPEDESDLLGSSRKLVDILIESSGSQPRKLYRFEAKRCARKIFNSKYTMQKWYSDGINDYLELHYARHTPEAGLLGLIQSDDVSYWKAELVALLSNAPLLRCQSPLEEIDIIPDLPDMIVSEHLRADNSTIKIYHAFLDCKTI